MAELIFDAPAVKKKSPIHLADLTVAERKARAEELGLPAFRANQLAVHFFTHHSDDMESFTDIPKELRAPLTDAFLPKLLTLVRSVTCDGGKTRKDLWRLHDGVLVECVIPIAQLFAYHHKQDVECSVHFAQLGRQDLLEI